jgi:hypothetical protein
MESPQLAEAGAAEAGAAEAGAAEAGAATAVGALEQFQAAAWVAVTGVLMADGEAKVDSTKVNKQLRLVLPISKLDSLNNSAWQLGTLSLMVATEVQASHQ